MPTAEQIQQAIREVTDQRSFIDILLRDTLSWPIHLDFEEIEDITYEWSDDDLNAVGLSRDTLSGPVLQMQSLEQENEQPWGIFILQFANEAPLVTGRGLTGPLRKVLRGLVSKRRDRQANLPAWKRGNLLFICTHNYQHFRFAYFKPPKEQGHAEPLVMFGWEPDTHARTVCEHNLVHLNWPDEPGDSDKWIAHWQSAFDVEKVTKRFYEDYEEVFTNLQTQLDLPNEEDKKMFAQILINRLMFLRFVERKGWLRLGDTNPKEYLKNLYQTGRINNLSWYRSRLQVLFFEGLAVPNHNREDVIGSVPYLNGGLFTITEWDERAGDIADGAFEPILGENGLLYRYNFTVEESTPLDIEVAVDPEMLGKVFEKLVTARRQSGSYYTPRTVVSFMCRESLKGYLGSEWASLIDEHKNDDISVPQAQDLLAKLAELKVVDPACGSGAYLLGMLQELYTITELLDSRAEQVSAHDAYQRKLKIIQNNIYGVDLDEFAVNIARLRLWLSLAVEFEDSTPDPLPNLDYKIETGDSLISPDPSGGFPATFDDIARADKINEYDRLKSIYMNPQLKAENPGIEDRIDELKQEIKEYAHPDEITEGFDWRVEFAEVWSQKNGFDVVIANPPYGIKVDNSIRNQYFNQRSVDEKGQSKDSYGIFMARGIQLLKANGIMSYIVSDTWRTIKSHKPLRNRILNKTTVFHFLDLPAWIFDATVNTGIITFRKAQAPEKHELIAGDLRGIEKGDWKSLSDNLIAVSGHGPDIQTLNCARYTYPQILIATNNNLPFFVASPKLFALMNDSGNNLKTDWQEIGGKKVQVGIIKMNHKSLKIVKLGDICNIKRGIDTGKNDKYLFQRTSARGNYTDIEPYQSKVFSPSELSHLCSNNNLRIKAIKEGFSKTKKSNIGVYYNGKYIIPFDKGGESDAESGFIPNYHVETDYFIDWSTDSVKSLYERATYSSEKANLRNPEYWFTQGITYSARGIYSPSFRVNSCSVFDSNGSSIFFKVQHSEEQVLQLLGMLISKVIRYQIKNYSGHTVATEVDELKRVSLLVGDININNLVNHIIKIQKTNSRYDYASHEQTEIDRLIYEAYGLNEEDIREIEFWYCRRYPKLAEAQGVTTEVKEKYADHLARCERILQKPPSYWRSNPVLELIAQGESHTLEFKETLEYDIRQNQRVAGLAKASLKTIAAFLNADGGILLIGVSDAGEVKGIARDLRFVRGNNRDGFEQKLRSLINDHFDPSPLGNVEIRFEDLQEGTVCQINVERSSEPVSYDKDFYIRDGNGTRKLEGRDLADWLRQRNNT